MWKDVQEGLRNESSWLQSLIQSGRTFTKIFDSDLLQRNRVGLLVILPSVLFQSYFCLFYNGHAFFKVCTKFYLTEVKGLRVRTM